MKKIFAVVGMLMLFAAPVFAQDANNAPAASSAAPAGGDPTPAPTKKGPKMAGGDEAGIKKAFADLSDAWSNGDAKAVASHFTTDSTLINPMGMEGQGMDQVEKIIESDLSGPMKGTQQAFDNFSFVWVMPNMALVDCTATITGMKKPDGTDMGPTQFHVYSVVVNRGGKGWKARAVRAYAFLQPPSAAGSGDASSTPTTSGAGSDAPAGGTTPTTNTK